MPAVIGRAIDRGVAATDDRALLDVRRPDARASALVQAVGGIFRHRFAVRTG